VTGADWISLLFLLLVGGCNLLNAVSTPQNFLRPIEDEKIRTLAFDVAYQSGVARLRVGQADEAVKLLTKAVRLEPRNKLARCTLGRAFIQAGKPAESVEEFRECVKLDPADPQARYHLGQAYLRLALSKASRVLEIDKASSYARRIFAENYLGKNDLSQAETQYQLALASQPAAMHTLLAFWRLYIREGKLGKASQEFSRAVERAPASVAAHYNLAKVEFLRQELSSTLDQLRWVAKVNPKFLSFRQDFPESVAPEATWKSVCNQLSNLNSKDTEDSGLLFVKDACRRAQSLRTDSSLELQAKPAGLPSRVVPSSSQVEKTLLTPEQACLAGLCQTCEEQLRKFSPDRLREPPGLLDLGRCAYDIGDYESAYHHFSAAEKSDTRNLEVLYRLQEAARQLALASFDRVRQTDPDSFLIHLLNAQTLEKQGKPELAAQEYRAAIARRPKAINIRVLLGGLYYKWQRYQEALAALQEALRLDPDDLAANYLVGDTWVKMQEPEKAVLYLRRALALRPGFLNAEASLARVFAQTGKFEEAVTELKKVAGADRDGSLHYQLYHLYLKLGQQDSAKQALATSERIRSKHQPQTLIQEDAHTP